MDHDAAIDLMLRTNSIVLGIQRSVTGPSGGKAGQAAHTDAVTIVKRRDDVGKRASGLPKNLSEVIATTIQLCACN